MFCRKGGQLMKFEEEPTWSFMFNLFFLFHMFIYILHTIYYLQYF